MTTLQTAIIRRLSAALVDFQRDGEGSVAIMFAVALIPTIIVVGAGIDYGRAVSERSMLQSGVDAAALAGIQQVHRGLAVADASTTVKQVVAVNDANPLAYVSNVTLSPDGTTLCVSAVSSVPTTLMAISGYKNVAVGATACSSMNLDTYEIAFAMDNSASMSNSAQSGGKNKMQYAQQAAAGLIQALAPNPNTGSMGVPVSYSVTPFSSSVNVGPANQGASWLDMAGQSSIHFKSFSYVPKPASPNSPVTLWNYLNSAGVAWGGCVEERPYPYTTSDDAPSASIPDTLFTPFFWPDETDNNPYGSNYNQLTFNNYAGDMSGSCQKGDVYDLYDRFYGRGDGQTKLCKYTSKLASTSNKYYVTGQYAGPNSGCVTTPLTPLNATQSTVTNAINAMSPAGDTGLATGFMWAWRTISPNGAFATTGSRWSTSGAQQPKPYGYVDPKTTAVNHKVIILMTDGENDWFGQDGDQIYTNNQNITQYDPNKMVYNAMGFPQEGRLNVANISGGPTTTSNARSQLDQATLNACNAAKATKDANGKPAPVEIYTVGFLASDGIDQPGRNLLANCATDASHAFLAATGDALVAEFQQIAAAISAPRIQK